MKPKPLARNPNRHTADGMAALAQSMAEDGYTAPMVAAADGTVINGNARLEQAGEIFGDVEPIIVKPSDRVVWTLARPQRDSRCRASQDFLSRGHRLDSQRL